MFFACFHSLPSWIFHPFLFLPLSLSLCFLCHPHFSFASVFFEEVNRSLQGKSRNLSFNVSSVSSEACGFRQVMPPLWVLVSFSIKWGHTPFSSRIGCYFWTLVVFIQSLGNVTINQPSYWPYFLLVCIFISFFELCVMYLIFTCNEVIHSHLRNFTRSLKIIEHIT